MLKERNSTLIIVKKYIVCQVHGVIFNLLNSDTGVFSLLWLLTFVIYLGN